VRFVTYGFEIVSLNDLIIGPPPTTFIAFLWKWTSWGERERERETKHRTELDRQLTHRHGLGGAQGQDGRSDWL